MNNNANNTEVYGERQAEKQNLKTSPTTLSYGRRTGQDYRVVKTTPTTRTRRARKRPTHRVAKTTPRTRSPPAGKRPRCRVLKRAPTPKTHSCRSSKRQTRQVMKKTPTPESCRARKQTHYLVRTSRRRHRLVRITSTIPSQNDGFHRRSTTTTTWSREDDQNDATASRKSPQKNRTGRETTTRAIQPHHQGLVMKTQTTRSNRASNRLCPRS
jgi:hypothetical protein